MNPITTPNTKSIKIAVLGSPNVGKTTYIHSICNDEDVFPKTKTECLCKLNFCYAKVTFVEEKQDADAYIIMFDVTKPDSFAEAKSLVLESKVPYSLVANKIDLEWKINPMVLRYLSTRIFYSSVQGQENTIDPLMHVFRKVFNDPKLHFRGVQY